MRIKGWIMLLMMTVAGALLTVPSVAQDDALPLRLTDDNIHDATLRDLGGGEYEIQTTGPDPYLFTAPLANPVDPARHTTLAFEYFSTTGTDKFQVFLSPPLNEGNSVSVTGLANSEGWSGFSVDLQPVLERIGPNLQTLRLDFGNAAGKNIRLRALRLRPPTEQEQALAARRVATREREIRLDRELREYLRRDYPAQVTKVAVDDAQVRVEGTINETINDAPDTLFLAEVPLDANVTEMTQFPTVQPLRANVAGRFSLSLERRREGDNAYDRLLSRWAVVRQKGDGYELLSHARYADSVRPRWNLPAEKPRNKKGLGGISVNYPLSDLDDLDIGSATVNLVLNGLLHTAPAPGRTPYEYSGRTWYVDDNYVARFDTILLEAAKRNIIVSIILLIGQPGGASAGSYNRLLAYPDADPSGIFVMPDVSSEEGVEAYAAGINFLAARYSRPDKQHGRIHHWIMHNEVNAGWVWTNAGEKTALRYMDLYHKSMRLVHLIARQYNPHTQVFISLEHHWTSPNARIYGGRELMEWLAEFSRAEGDFEWALAHHPYPQSLLKPRVWEDDQPTFAFDTPKITFKNLEVLEAWMKQPAMLFEGRPRAVHLTEQGLNSPDYSETSLRDQAAGMAYTWKKMEPLSTITVFDYHNWVDNRGEGGLRIGLRRFPDDATEPLGKKPIWHVYTALGTDREAEAIAFAKPVIGIQDWDEVHYRGTIK